jgi:hypothetical protein
LRWQQANNLILLVGKFNPDHVLGENEKCQDQEICDLIPGILIPFYFGYPIQFWMFLFQIHRVACSRLSHDEEVLESAKVKVEAKCTIMPQSRVRCLAPSGHADNINSLEISGELFVDVKADWRELFLCPLIAY